MSKPVIFHCSPYGEHFTTKDFQIVRTTPTHTMVFTNIGDTLVMGWAVTHKGDSYNRKIGRELATERASHLETRLKSHKNRQITELDEISIDVLPKKLVNKNFGYCVNRAVKILFSNNHTFDNIDVIFRAHDGAEASVCKVNVSIDK